MRRRTVVRKPARRAEIMHRCTGCDAAIATGYATTLDMSVLGEEARIVHPSPECEAKSKARYFEERTRLLTTSKKNT